MSVKRDEIKETVKFYLLEQCLPGEEPGALNDTTGLIVTGILDSIATVKLVAFLEEQYGIELKAYELDADNLKNLSTITNLIESKLAQ